MARSARRYDLFLPIAYNDGRPIEDEKFDALEQILLLHFRGFTFQRREFPMKGVWQGKTRLYYDPVVMIIILDVRRGGSSAFVTRLKAHLLEQFDQEDILITETPQRVF